MSKRRFSTRMLVAFICVLLSSTALFAFPHDPNPSTIDDGYFPGNWSNALRSFSDTRESAINSMRLMLFMDKEFKEEGAGPGGPLDLKIWNTPAFTSDKVNADNNAWQWLIANPQGQIIDKEASGLGHIAGTVRGVPVEHGKSMYTTHDEMVAFIEAMPRTNLTVEYLGEIPRGFPFPFLIFSTNSDRTPSGLAASGKPLIWVQGNIHGGEWSGGEGCLAMAYDLANGRYNNLLAKVNVIIIPRICADGGKFPIRGTNDLVALQWTPDPERRDLNRDNMLLDLQVTRAMKKMNVAYRPHFCVDLHERGSSRIIDGITETFGMLIDSEAHDIGSSGPTIPQVPMGLKKLHFYTMEPDLAAMGKEYGLHFGIYTEGTDTYNHGILTNYAAGMPYAGANYANGMINSAVWDPDAPYRLISHASTNIRTARNINATYGTVSQLYENKAGPTNVGNRGMFERRVATGYVCILSTITTAANRANEILSEIETIRGEMVAQGKTVSASDKIPILPLQPKPRYIDEREWTVIDLSIDYTGASRDYFQPSNPYADLTGVVRYDGTKALQKTAAGQGFAGSDYIPVQGTGSRSHQFFKVEENWLGTAVRERIRPYAYIFEGPYADELAMRMMLAGIEVRRLAQDVTIDVEGWHYNARTIGTPGANSDPGPAPYIDMTNSGASGWLNRDVTIYEIPDRKFEKGAYVVYLGQLLSNLIPMYMEPDLPWNVASCIFLPYMSTALGGNPNGVLDAALVGMEMPAYRYLKEVDLPTYSVDNFLPLVDRGAVARFFAYHTPEEIAEIAAAVHETAANIKVYDYDFQVHTRTDALVNNRFNITLPTSSRGSKYLIMKTDGSYEELIPNSQMLGWNVGTVKVYEHGNNPFTVDIDPLTGLPKVGDGSNRTLALALPAHDDLIGVRIVEIAGAAGGGGGGSSCDAGFAPFALLAFAMLAVVKSRKN